MKKQDAEAIGLARYGVIASLVGRKFNTPDERAAEVQRVADSVHKFPDNQEKTVSVRQIQRWLSWYQNGRQLARLTIEPGIWALEPIIRKDYGALRVVDAALVDRAVQLRREQPKRTTATLIQLLKSEAEQRHEPWEPMAETTLAFHMRRRNATRRELKREGRTYPRYEHDHRNAVWQGDWSEGIWLPHPTEPGKVKRCHLHAFKDDQTRYIPHAEFYFRQNLPCLEDCFRKAVLNGGVPEITYVDNGAVYQAKQMQRMAARLGTQLVYATPYHPQGKGKIERFFGHTKMSFYPEAERAGITTLKELNTFFWAWLQEYHERVHSETGETPRARWEAGASGVRWANSATLGDLFLWEEERLVNKAGCVDLGGNNYPVPEHLVGCRVSVRFDPFDLSTVRIYYKDKLETVTGPHALVSQTFRKAMPRRIEKLAPVESSVAFRKQMSEALQQDAAARLGQSHGHDGESGQACLTRSELSTLLSEVLGGRTFTVEEKNRIADFFNRYAPLLAQVARAVLQQAVEEEEGCQLHLRFYLDTLRQARAGGRPEGVLMVGYRQFHGLGRPPFGKSVEAGHLLLYPQLEEFCGELDELVLEGGVGLLTGDMGIGKTTALRHYVGQLQAQSVQLQLAYHGSSRDSVGVLSGLVEALGVVPTTQRVPLLRQLSNHTERTYREQRKKSLLVIDDAHLLPDDLYEDLRLATNQAMDSSDAVVLLLAGHSALRARLAKPVHLALLDRVRMHYRLEGLSQDETVAYVDHHLKQAGGRPDIFTQAAKHAIFEHSGGIPRRINAIALLALKKSATRKLTSIDADFIAAILHMLIQNAP